MEKLALDVVTSTWKLRPYLCFIQS